MVNTFMDAITIALANEFGDSHTYYVEKVEQKLRKPCFFVQPLNPMYDRKNRWKHKLTVPVVVYYFTDKDETSNANRDCYSVGERLHKTLEYLPVKDCTVRGYGIEWEVNEGVLQLHVTYNLELISGYEFETGMESVDYQVNGYPVK